MDNFHLIEAQQTPKQEAVPAKSGWSAKSVVAVALVCTVAGAMISLGVVALANNNNSGGSGESTTVSRRDHGHHGHHGGDNVSSLKMDCPPGVNLCATMSIESGLGGGNYGGGVPGVHGLWPEVGQYGTSDCIKPKDNTFDSPGRCNYINDDENCAHYIGQPAGKSGPFCFPYHEWTTHGMCSGGPGPASRYFTIMCDLADPIVTVLTAEAKGDWHKMQSIVGVKRTGGGDKPGTGVFPEGHPNAGELLYDYLWRVDTNHLQFLMTVCSHDNGDSWVYCKV